jgi:hypothetical protein
MKRLGFEKSKRCTHGHNDCGICSGNFKGKANEKVKVKKQIDEELPGCYLPSNCCNDPKDCTYRT